MRESCTKVVPRHRSATLRVAGFQASLEPGRRRLGLLLYEGSDKRARTTVVLRRMNARIMRVYRAY